MACVGAACQEKGLRCLVERCVRAGALIVRLPHKTGRAVRLPARRARFFAAAPRGEQRLLDELGLPLRRWAPSYRPQKRPVQARLRCAVSSWAAQQRSHCRGQPIPSEGDPERLNAP